MRTIDPEQLATRLDAGETVCIIDVREDEEVAAGMIPGARHIPMGTIPDRLADIPRDGEVVLVCRSGARSGRVHEYLAAQGYANLVNMNGGMMAWERR
ncbi:rhodanese-like domain-containing protein [Paenibacillus antri]|uniref:Rhodanese-like domain-containing protein n=1 Tax=Paenibacillus antri TaxID=2582848 RepID=A0A5R9G6K9_9BACL|nr:rhodanese-like domain-containing protein [Paenibacillus antri]TLS49976.1 rhodanese-like domain-containing protein [Paenibacillus antri]